jgi:hypothetical protein
MNLHFDDPANYFIMLPKDIYDIFFKEKNGGDLIAVYSFYCYTAKWQHTNTPKATNHYCMKGLGFGESRFLKTKLKLISMGLIQKVFRPVNNGGWFIKINNQISKDHLNLKNLEKQELGKPGGNTKENNTINAYIINKYSQNLENKVPKIKRTTEPFPLKNKKYQPLAEKLRTILQNSKHIKIQVSQIKAWSNDIRLLHSIDGISTKRINTVLDWYEIHSNDQYTPIVNCAKSLRSKFTQLEAAIKRNGYKLIQNCNGTRNLTKNKIDYSQIKVKQINNK